MNAEDRELESLRRLREIKWLRDEPTAGDELIAEIILDLARDLDDPASLEVNNDPR